MTPLGGLVHILHRVRIYIYLEIGMALWHFRWIMFGTSGEVPWVLGETCSNWQIDGTDPSCSAKCLVPLIVLHMHMGNVH
jgi:hypothetical protein